MIEQDKLNTNNQLNKIKTGSPFVKLINPCSVGNGIISCPQISSTEKINESVEWFIPASGSGSRMFQFLFDFLQNKKETDELIQFKTSLKSFAFYQLLEGILKEKFENEKITFEEIIKFCLFEEGLNFSKLPKGMIPFHLYKNGIRNAFQEQVIQGKKLPADKISFHFTIQNDFSGEIKEAISSVIQEDDINVLYSEQYTSTDSIAFDENFEPLVLQNGEILKRPAGHGALIENLNQINSDFILIKNIDNIQHEGKSEKSIQEWEKLLMITKDVRERIYEIWKNPNHLGLVRLNNDFNMFQTAFISELNSEDEIKTLLNRPLRICGMVKNIGQPGGGPFWVEKDGFLSKQIVDKAQIYSDFDQQQIFNQSTHFNPVMLVASTKDFSGNKFNLLNFVDEETYFVVKKTHEGKSIQYIERPGLWNGAMAKWNTVFVEVPSEVFSPVKTLLDLLDESHIG